MPSAPAQVQDTTAQISNATQLTTSNPGTSTSQLPSNTISSTVSKQTRKIVKQNDPQGASARPAAGALAPSQRSGFPQLPVPMNFQQRPPQQQYRPPRPGIPFQPIPLNEGFPSLPDPRAPRPVGHSTPRACQGMRPPRQSTPAVFSRPTRPGFRSLHSYFIPPT